MKTTHRTLYSGAVALFLVLAGAIQAQPTPTGARLPYPHAVLNVYSGVANPAWESTPADVARLLALIEKLPTGNETKGMLQQLGYRGFSLAVSDEKVIHVYRDTIQIVTRPKGAAQATIVYKRDDARSIEAELTELAEKHGKLEADHKSAIQSGLDRRKSAKG
jgi:hypothetical protein